MLKWILRIALVLVVVVGIAFWWLLLGSKAPKTAEGEFDIAAYRALVAGDATETLARRLHIETISTDDAPSIATEAGNFSGKVRMAMTSLQISYAGNSIIIGGSVNEDYASEAAQSDAAVFHTDAYDRMVEAMAESELVLITHEHPDHVMAITHYPDPEALAPKLRLNAAQLETLPIYAPNGVLAPAIAEITPMALDGPIRIAPGLVAAPTPGHSKGSTTFYLRIQDGSEYLLIGDIVWMMSNIEALKSRPRLLELVFHLGEDRKAVQRQVRALHDLTAAEPDLIIIPSHDGVYLDGLVAEGRLVDGFVVWSE